MAKDKDMARAPEKASAHVLEVQRKVEAATGVHLVPELRRVAFAGLAGARPGAPEAWPGEDHAGLVEDTDGEESGMEVDAAVELVLTVVEAHGAYSRWTGGGLSPHGGWKVQPS